MLRELGDSIRGEVFLNRDGGVRGDVLTETAVESQTVGEVVGQGLRVGRQSLLLKLQVMNDMLIQLVLWHSIRRVFDCQRLTPPAYLGTSSAKRPLPTTPRSMEGRSTGTWP